jgi:quinoprotein glucose dehydrogenase
MNRSAHVLLSSHALVGLMLGAGLLLQSGVVLSADAAQSGVAIGEWPTYGHDAGGMRFSPLTQIDAGNVAKLQRMWVYHMRPATAATAAAAAPALPAAPAEAAQALAEGVAAPAALAQFLRRRAASRFSASQTTPLVVGGRMYISTPYRHIVALQPETGQEIWNHELPGPGLPSLRGVEYWPGDRTHGARIVFGTRDGSLIALDAATGEPAAGFGVAGVVDMKTPDVIPATGNAASPMTQYGMTSPPLVWRNLVITGAAVQEYPALGSAGDVRAWDVLTGKLAWTFHTVPREGEFGHDTWEGDSWKNRSGVNAWGFITADAVRGIVYVPLGAPSWDRYGGDRHGDNLFSTSLVALDARTGKRLWHFQLVHHDVWDMDLSAPPLLFDATQNGRKVPAVALVSKSGMYFVFNRVTGKPLLPIEERPVPASNVPGEQAAKTQPFPTVTPPYARQTFSIDDVAKVTPELEAYCRKWIEQYKMQGGSQPYQPIRGDLPSIVFPGHQGGANWGGASYSPALDLLFVNANNLGQVEQLLPRPDGSYTAGGDGSGRFMQADTKLNCQQPPWGTLTAIRASTGAIAWQVPLGVTDSLPAALQKTGRQNIGGSIATASGLVFIGATDDARIRAFDAKSGSELWAFKLEASAHATPITYLGKDGKQYVAVVGTGGSFLDSPIDSDALSVFALP